MHMPISWGHAPAWPRLLSRIIRKRIAKMIPKSRISDAVKKVFPHPAIKSIQLLTKGIINENYEVQLEDQALIVRTYPKEPWKARKEEYLYGLLKKKGIPVPDVHAVDTSGKIMPRAYIILSAIKGERLSMQMKDSESRKLMQSAGEILGKIHQIQMPKYGWIVDNKIKPAFDSWASFVKYDLEEKLSKLRNIKKVSPSLLNLIRTYFQESASLLQIKQKPRLLHKDYHPSHILVKDRKIAGIIDLEWAIAGHTEMDLAKTKLFLFDRNPETRKPFLLGYMKTGALSKDFTRRMPLYELSLLVSSLWFAHQNNQHVWFENDLKRIRHILS